MTAPGTAAGTGAASWCASCRFARGYILSLTCHRSPPWISALSDGTAFARTHADGIWPKVKPSDWCGEWAALPSNPSAPPDRAGDAPTVEGGRG